MQRNYYSQFLQDEFLYNVIFRGKLNGFFIDIGAHDGMTINNTYFFEKLNWDGICIEPNPQVYNILSANRKCETMNVCVGFENKIVNFTQVFGHAEMLSGVTDKYDERHLNRIKSEIMSMGGKAIQIKVPMVTFESIYSIHDKVVDFVSIDTEGNELEIIESINFDKNKIRTLVVENNYNDNRINDSTFASRLTT